MNLTDRVAELRGLEAKITPGEWFSHDEYITTKDEIDIDGEGDRHIDIPHDSYDADFIADMRNAAPKLLDALDFRAGDADRLKWIGENCLCSDMFDQSRNVDHCNKCIAKDDCDTLRRYQAMATRMEAKGNAP